MSADAQEGERLGVGGLPIHGGLTPVNHMTLREFVESGLLLHVNRTALWPFGVALAVTADGDDYTDLHVRKLGAWETITAHDDGVAEREAALESWIRERVAS
jgi:hypothetical protein